MLFNKTTATGRKLLVVDASMTELIRPALYGSYHNIENITAETDRTDKYTVVGTACESTDKFDENVSLRRSVRGDLLTIKSAAPTACRWPRATISTTCLVPSTAKT